MFISKSFKLKLNGNGTLYISPRALTHLLSYSLICLHNSLVFHLKLVPGFRAYFYFLGVGEGGGWGDSIVTLKHNILPKVIGENSK